MLQEKEKEIELRSEAVQDVMGDVPPSILRWGISIIALVVLLLMVVSYFFKFPDKVSGTVTLTTEGICTVCMPAQGSGKVVVGQRVVVRLFNFPDQEFGYLEGRVEQISNTPDSNGIYLVNVRFTNGLVTNYGIQLPNNRQMQGSADIITQDVRLLVRFFNPIKNLLLKYT